jgi:hypothetical protein
MKKIYRFKILSDYKPHASIGDIREGYYSSFMGYPIVSLMGKLGLPRQNVEELEFVREESWVSPVRDC